MGFGLKKEVTANVTPSTIVYFDQLTPTTIGVVFDPDTPETIDVLYVSSIDASTWIWDGSAYVTYVAPVTSSTEWYLYNTTIDAGSNKTNMIDRQGSIAAPSFNNKRAWTYTGASNDNKWWRVFDYEIANNYTSDSFKVQMNEFNDYGGSGKSIIFDIIVKRQDPSSYLTVNIDSGVTTFDLYNFDVRYNSTTKRLSFYYRLTTTYTYTNWLVLNSILTSNFNYRIIWYNTLIGASLSGQPNDPITTKTISLNKINGVYTLPSAKATVAGQVLADPLADGNLSWVTSGGGGIWGIANASGIYTYYATYPLARAASVAGQTIDMFGSQTESSSDHILKNGVNINYNGYTLTFTSGFGIIDNNVACEVQLLNGEIKKGVAGQIAITVTNSGTIIRGNVLVNSTLNGGYGLYGPVTVYGLQFKGANPLVLYSATTKGKAYGVTINCTDGDAVAYGEIYDSVINSTSVTGSYAIYRLITVRNCTGIINGGIGFYMEGTSITNSSFTNLTSRMLAFATQDDNFIDNCYFRCSADVFGANNAQGKGLMSNTKVSGFSYLWRFDGNIINMDKCTLISDTSYTFYLCSGATFNFCTFIVRDTVNSFQDLISGTIKLNNCNFQLANASAYPVYGGSAKNFTASNNTYNTTNFQLNMTNLQTFTADAYGNQRLN